MRNNKFNTIAWDVDTQVDFMERNVHNSKGYEGKLVIQNAMDIAYNLRELNSYLRQSNIPIFGSVDWHKENAFEFPKKGESPNFVNTFPKHCIAGTFGAQKIKATKPINPLYINLDQGQDERALIQTIKKHQGEVFFRKDRFDVFDKDGNPYAKNIISELEVKKAIVYGVALEVCNDFAIKGLRDLGVEVYAVEDCMKAINEDTRPQILQSWKDIGAKIITLENVLNGEYLN